jgi:hypothetical protein
MGRASNVNILDGRFSKIDIVACRVFGVAVIDTRFGGISYRRQNNFAFGSEAVCLPGFFRTMTNGKWQMTNEK